MVRRESRAVPADESSARVGVGAPGSRVQSEAEMPLAERTDKSLQGGSNAAGRNASERRASLEKDDVQADPTTLAGKADTAG